MIRSGRFLTCAPVLLFAGSACGGVYEEVAPPEKRVVETRLSPDFVRAGESDKEVVVDFCGVEPANAFLTEFDLGPGLNLDLSNSEQSCAPSVEAPDCGEDPFFRLCLTIDVDASVEVAVRQITLDISASGAPVLGEADLVVLSARQ